MKRIIIAAAVLGIVQTPAFAQRALVERILSQAGQDSGEAEPVRRDAQVNATPRRQKVPEDGQILSATTKWGTCYTAQGQAYKCAMQRGTDGTPATNELPPNAKYPYWHTKQLCRGSDGSKKPCRIYR